MFQSVTRVVSKSSNLDNRNVYRESPKTRLNGNDRSASSPRLKSFPAEKIRKIDCSVIPTSSKNVNETHRMVNSGQGDASQDFQNAQFPRAIQNQGISSSSEARVFKSSYPTENHAHQSQAMIPSNRAMESCLLERAPHRPCVPYCHHAPYAVTYSSASGAQRMSNNRENSSGHVESCSQPQYYYQQQGFPMKISQNLDNRINMMSDKTSQSLPQIPSANGTINVPVGDKKMYQARETNEIVEQPSNNNIRMENVAKSQAKKKALKFTPRMIKDQELLVATMRQQGIKEDIMQRQFEALLSEQRKQLLYLEALDNPEMLLEGKCLEERKVQRRISRIEEDGKPEWMLHITPPRIPYAVWEKMRAERQTDLAIVVPSEPKLVDHWPGNQTDCQSSGNGQNVAQEIHENSGQMCAPNIGQREAQYSYVPSNNNNVGMARYEQTSQSYSGQHHQQKMSCEQRMKSETLPSSQKDDGKNVKNVAASSLLQLRIYKEVIRRQKQNNGLQDAETIKEAMEALKNPANRKGLEYLENYNKKREKPVTLNGAQEPEDMSTSNHQYETHVSQRALMKAPSANGLANARNPNNPLPREILRHKKIEQNFVGEYPMQKQTFNYREYYSPAERENGTIAMGTANTQACIVNDKKSLASGPTAGHNQLVNPHNQQPKFNPQNPHNNHDNNRKHCNHFYPVNHQHRVPPKSGYFTTELAHQQFYDPRKDNDLCEPIIIGGVKYLARKPMYAQNGPPHYLTNHTRSLNPTIPCQ